MSLCTPGIGARKSHPYLGHYYLDNGYTIRKTGCCLYKKGDNRVKVVSTFVRFPQVSLKNEPSRMPMDWM